MPRQVQPELNVPLLRKVVDHIMEHPEEWDQRYWARNIPRWIRMRRAQQGIVNECGTTRCIAGWAVYYGDDQAQEIRESKNGCMYLVKTGSGQSRAIWQHAQELLGLTEKQATQIFWKINTKSPRVMKRHIENVTGVQL